MIVHSFYHSDIYLTVFQKNYSHPMPALVYRIFVSQNWPSGKTASLIDALLSTLTEDMQA
ncbi:MAG: hypothetical protein RMZ69_18810 [Nostoc sp. ChiQUE01a]|nr:hypothetical protein [Nostoc sp. ChiQUE01a]